MRAAPVGLENTIPSSSPLSEIASFVIGTRIVLAVSPAANVSVPEVAV